MATSVKKTPGSKTRLWQLAFLIGVTTSFLAACFVLGLSIFTPLVALLILIASFLNKLLGPKDSAAIAENVLISNLKQILNVGVYLKTLTLVAWVSTIGLIGYGLYGLYASKQIVSVHGFVETYDGKPADDVFVTLRLTSEKRTAVTRQGEFTFSEIDLRKEHSNRCTLEVSWNNKVTSTIVDLRDEQRTRLVIKIPADDAPLRVTYYSVGGPAIDLLVKGQLDKRWETTLGGQPFIFPTKPLDQIRSLVKRYRERPYADEVFYPDPDLRHEDDLETDINHDQSYFIGARSDIAFNLPIKELQLPDKETVWNIIVSDSTVASERITFWKFASDEEIQRFTDSKWQDFYEYITKDATSRNSGIIYSTPHPCTSEPQFNLEVREISLRVVVFENAGTAPVNIDNLTVRQNNASVLRLRDDDQALLSKASYDKLTFPPRILKPSEKLLVPLELVFAFDRTLVDALTARGSEKARKDLMTNAKEGQGLRVTAGAEAIEIKPPKILDMMRTDQKDLLNSEYVFGPSMTIASVRINATEYPVRNYDRKTFVIRGTFEIGSCPYIYTSSIEQRSWLREGRILYGKDGKDKESVDSIPLKNFHGSVLIKEIDPETSYIDSLHITAMVDGREIRLASRNPKLRYNDGDYLILKMGQQIRVDFEIPRGLHLNDYVLVAKGYYVSY